MDVNDSLHGLLRQANIRVSDIQALLLTDGAQINYRDTKDRTPLIYALQHNCDEDVIITLLNAPDLMSVNEADIDLRSPLILAIQKGYSLKVVKILLQSGADVNCEHLIEEYWPRSPIISALQRRNVEIILALLKAPDFIFINENRMCRDTNPLLYAIHQNLPTNILHILIEFGADLGYRSHIYRMIILRTALRFGVILKLLMRYWYKNIEPFCIVHLFQCLQNSFVSDLYPGLVLSEEAAMFGFKCKQELRLMRSFEVSNRTLLQFVREGRGNVTDEDLDILLSQLFDRRVDIVCPIYLIFILFEVEKQLVTKLHDVVLRKVRNNSVSGLGKIFSILVCARGVAKHLNSRELFKLILIYTSRLA